MADYRFMYKSSVRDCCPCISQPFRIFKLRDNAAGFLYPPASFALSDPAQLVT